MMQDYALEYALKLLSIPSPSGYTKEAVDYTLNVLRGLGFDPQVSRKGTILCELGGEGHGIVLSGHLDTLGGMVRSIKPNGRIRYTKLGGWSDAMIENENCTVHTRDGRAYSGTVLHVKASQHVFPGMGAEPRNDETLEIVLDELVKTAADVEALGIDNGCYISWDPRTVLTPSGFLKSRHLDDKVCAGMLLALARMVSEGKITLRRRVAILFTVFEEVNHGASIRLPEGIEDMLALDMGCVGDDLRCDETMVSICAKDNSGPYHYEFTCELVEAAKQAGLRFTTDIYPSYSSDCTTALRAGNDVRYALIGPGIYASHSYERTHLKGIENTCALVLAYLDRPMK